MFRKGISKQTIDVKDEELECRARRAVQSLEPQILGFRL